MAESEAVYGLTKDGFRRKRLPEILSDINRRVSDRLGVEIETGSNSLFGQLHGVFAYEIADLWEQAENIYNAMYPNTATGVSLSNAAGLAGIVPVAGTKSMLTATCYGTDGTSIPYGARIASSAQNGSTWSCIEDDAAITSSKAIYAALVIRSDIVTGNTYKLTVNDVETSYTAVDKDTAVIVLNALSKTIGSDNIKTSIDNNVLSIRASSARSEFRISAKGLTITSIGSPIRFKCINIGAIEADTGTVTSIVTTTPGWSAVNNEYPTNVGQDAESDIALRQRWSAAVYQRSRAMVESIQNGVYTNVDGVTSCLVYENTSDKADDDDRPPHSIEVVATGGEPEDIAKEIWQRKPAGIDTFGSVSNVVFDSQGAQHTIKFNRPQEIKIWVHVVVGTNPDEVFSNAALQEIKDAVLAKGLRQNIGEDVILQRYFAAIFESTTGIGYINLTAATGDKPGSYTSDNIVISPRQVAAFDASRIEVAKQ